MIVFKDVCFFPIRNCSKGLLLLVDHIFTVDCVAKVHPDSAFFSAALHEQQDKIWAPMAALVSAFNFTGAYQIFELQPD